MVVSVSYEPFLFLDCHCFNHFLLGEACLFSWIVIFFSWVYAFLKCKYIYLSWFILLYEFEYIYVMKKIWISELKSERVIIKEITQRRVSPEEPMNHKDVDKPRRSMATPLYPNLFWTNSSPCLHRSTLPRASFLPSCVSKIPCPNNPEYLHKFFMHTAPKPLTPMEVTSSLELEPTLFPFQLMLKILV